MEKKGDHATVFQIREIMRVSDSDLINWVSGSGFGIRIVIQADQNCPPKKGGNFMFEELFVCVKSSHEA
jgi:hypothetical protein